MEHIENQAIKVSDVIGDELMNRVEDFKIRFETIQQICDLLSDMINNFDWSTEDKNELVYIWTRTIRIYWSLCQKCGINPMPKL